MFTFPHPRPRLRQPPHAWLTVLYFAPVLLVELTHDHHGTGLLTAGLSWMNAHQSHRPVFGGAEFVQIRMADGSLFVATCDLSGAENVDGGEVWSGLGQILPKCLQPGKLGVEATGRTDRRGLVLPALRENMSAMASQPMPPNMTS